MTTNTDRNTRSLTLRTSKSLSRRRDDSGLTTLEWLLIVAAVAGLAALAVVLVTNVVGDTSEQISGSSARKTAAQVAASEIQLDADRDASEQPAAAKTFGDWASYYASKCERIAITYADIEDLTVEPNFTSAKGNTTATTAVAASLIEVGDVTADTDSTSSGANAVMAECRVP